jgi:ureidoglycolate lyase
MPESFRELAVEPATPESAAPYGVLLGVDPAAPARTSSFYGDRVELWTPGNFVSDSDTTISLARVHPRPREVIWMERHFKHTQAFIPLGGSPFVVVVGAGTDTAHPDPSSVKALRFDGSAGFLMHVGTWHEFPFALERSTDMLVILRNETNRDLEVRENDEAVGGDLEKRNLEARLGFRLRF